MDNFAKRDGFRFKLQESMARVDLVHQHGSKFIPAVRLTAKDDLFKSDPSLTSSPSDIKSVIPRSAFQRFVSRAVAAVRGGWFFVLAVNICIHCLPFGLDDIGARVAAPKDCAVQHIRQIAVLQASLSRRTDFYAPTSSPLSLSVTVRSDHVGRQHLHHYHSFSPEPPPSLQ
jgi:hypothetical protein